MAYSDFTLKTVREAFGLIVEESSDMFAEILSTPPSQFLQTILSENTAIATGINTDKARSELIITPILLEVRRQFDFRVGFFSGSEFNVEPSLGLNGYCDYILTASSEIYEVLNQILGILSAPFLALLPQP